MHSDQMLGHLPVHASDSSGQLVGGQILAHTMLNHSTFFAKSTCNYRRNDPQPDPDVEKQQLLHRRCLETCGKTCSVYVATGEGVSVSKRVGRCLRLVWGLFEIITFHFYWFLSFFSSI